MFDRTKNALGALLLSRTPGLHPEEAWRTRQYKRARKIARRAGTEVYKPHLIWLQDREFLAVRGEAKRRGIRGNPSDRAYMLLELARKVRHIPGDAAECGLRRGNSTLFLLTGLGADSAKTLHGFDSFEGLSAPSAGDRDKDDRTAWKAGDFAVPEDVVLSNLADYADRVVLRKGWIPDRFAEIADRRFAIVHVDVDLYEPTLASVAFFYPRLNPGGVIVCDDYGSAFCPGAKKAIDEFFADKPEPVIALPTGQSVVFKQ